MKKGKMQKDLIYYLGMGRGTYTQWKIAANQSYRSHLPEIADYLGVSLDYLAGKCDSKDTTLIISDNTEMDLVLSFRKAHPDLQSVIMTLVHLKNI